MARLKTITLIWCSPSWKWQVAESIAHCYKGGIYRVGLLLQYLCKQRVHLISPYLIFPPLNWSCSDSHSCTISQKSNFCLEEWKSGNNGHEWGDMRSLLLTDAAPRWISSIYWMQRLITLTIYITTNLTFHNGVKTGGRLTTTKFYSGS